MADALRLEAATVRFGEVTAVRGLTGTFAAGEHVALIGPSGAGKTTLLRLVNASVLPSEGRVEVGGRDLASLATAQLRQLRRQVAVIHQDLRLVPNLRVVQNVLSGGFGRQGFWGAARAMLRPRREDLERAHALLERVGIGEKIFQRTDRLSGGQQQRVAIARALFQRPRILLADEPVASVDPERARDVIALLVDLAREEQMTLITSLHDLELARSFFPRVVGMRQGCIEWDGDPRQLAASDLRRLYGLTPRGGEPDGL